MVDLLEPVRGEDLEPADSQPPQPARPARTRVEEQPGDYRPDHVRRLWLRLRAPFAAFRPMQAGSLRTTLPAMPYSAAWGLVLNLAGVDVRSLEPEHHGTDPLAPCLRLCIGHAAATPARTPLATGHNRLFQHLHAYPVGRSSQRFQRGAHGAKYHIAPVQREILTDLDFIIGIEEAVGEMTANPRTHPDGSGPDANVDAGEPGSAATIATTASPSDASAAPGTPIAIIPRVHAALAGTADWPRTGLPFAGDNNLLFDHIEALASPPPAYWYNRVFHDRPREPGQPGAAAPLGSATEGTAPAASPGSAGPQPVTRLHVGIDRLDSSQTTTVEVSPLACATTDIPGTAWIWTPHPPYRPALPPFASGR